MTLLEQIHYAVRLTAAYALGAVCGLTFFIALEALWTLSLLKP